MPRKRFNILQKVIMDILSMVMSYALTYVATMYDYTTPPTVNWTLLNSTTWWGPAGEEATQDIGVYSTEITWSSDMIDDLKTRLRRNVSYVAPFEDVGFTYGFNRDQLANWTTFWAENYDFDARLEAFNQFPQYKTNIMGLDIHFIRVTPEVPDGVEVVPMLLLHGFLGSIREFFEVIPKITAYSEDRDYAIELIVPCLPGFGYSDAALRKNFGPAEMAIVLRGLMLRLGFQKYYIEGGDFGSEINTCMATLFPDEVLGFHTNWGHVISPIAVILQIVGTLFPPLVVEPELYNRMYPIPTLFEAVMGSIGYLHLQSTKPETLGVGLTDSPAGLLAYFIELMARITNIETVALGDGGLYSTFSQEEIIDDLMMYWAPNSINSAMRLYAEKFNMRTMGMRLDEIQTPVPVWVTQTKYEIYYQPPIILKLKFPNLLNTTVYDYGGHFMAWELPDEFSESVLTAVTAFRAWHEANGTSCDEYFYYPDE